MKRSRHFQAVSSLAADVAAVAAGANAEEAEFALSLEALHARYAGYVGDLVSRILGRAAGIENLVEDVLTATVPELQGQNNELEIKSWLAKATVQRCLRELRWQGLLGSVGLAPLRTYELAPAAEVSPDERRLIIDVYRALDRVPSRLRLAWALYHVVGERLDRSALLCGCSLATIERRIALAHEKLQRVRMATLPRVARARVSESDAALDLLLVAGPLRVASLFQPQRAARRSRIAVQTRRRRTLIAGLACMSASFGLFAALNASGRLTAPESTRSAAIGDEAPAAESASIEEAPSPAVVDNAPPPQLAAPTRIAAQPSALSLPAPARSEPLRKPSVRGWRAAAQAGDYAGAYAQLRPRDVADDAGDLLLAADVARLSGHPAGAVAPLRKFCQHFSRDERAAEAAFALGRVFADDLGRPAQAAIAFERAHALGPKGPLAQDALARAVDAFSKAGRATAARQIAKFYLRRFPDGSHAAVMRASLAL